MKTRIYVAKHGTELRLIRAKTRLDALNYAAKGIVDVVAITKEELTQYMEKGTPIEETTKDVK